MSAQNLDTVLADLEERVRRAAALRNIPREVRAALNEAVDALLAAQAAWSEYEGGQQ